MKYSISTWDVLREDWQPISFTVSLHLMILVLMVGWQTISQPKIYEPDYVKARLVQLTPQDSTKKPEPVISKPKAQPLVDRKDELRATQLKQEKIKQEKLKQEQLKQENIKKEAARQKLEADKLAREKAAQETVKKEQALKELAAAEKRRAEEAFAKALAQEQAQRQQLADVELAQAYATAIKQQVERNWSRPPSAKQGMEAWLEIQLVPTGYVVGVKLIKSSGNTAFDLSAEQAVQKIEQFVEIKGMPSRIFESEFRRFTLKFRPEDKL